MKHLKNIIFFLILIICFYIVFFVKNTVETNLISAVLSPKIQNYEEILSVADKSSSIIKIAFEGDLNKKEEFLSQTDKDFFEINFVDFSKFIEKYKESRGNFLSDNDIFLIQNKKYDELYQNAIMQLYNPVSFQVVPFSDDPYFLLSDFIVSNDLSKSGNENIETAQIAIKNETGLSAGTINKEIEKLIKLKTKFEDKNNKIYLSGTPIHSYYTSKNSIISINTITVLSLLLIIFISYFYFKNTKFVLPVVFSIAFGILAGFCAVKLLFHNFHIITMVFSTAIIGLGIDYSYHYFFDENKNKTFIKNLTFSMITTTVPFIIFYLTGLDLLKQIAVFSITGLLAIYYFVLTIYPRINITVPKKCIKPNIGIYKFILSAICLIALLGYFKFNFNDSLTSLYTPSKELIRAENVYNGVNNNQTQFIAVQGENTEDILENEEDIEKLLKEQNINYVSLSKFFPSIKKQKENLELVKQLYDSNLQRFKDILSDKQINDLKDMKAQLISPPEIKMFSLNKNTSIIYVFSSGKLNINNNKAKIINVRSDIEKYLKEYRYKLFKLFPIMTISVIILLCIFFGINKGLRIVIPPLLGIFSSMGLTALIFGELNLFSIISLFLILGFTVDYAIFKSQNPKSSNDAVFVSALTTGFSFLLLSFTSFRLISSIAIVLTFGIIVSYLCSCLIFKEGE